MENTIKTCLRTNPRRNKFKIRIQRVKRAVLKCRICGVRNTTKAKLLKHLDTHIGTPITCRNCRKSFNSNASYLCHISLRMCYNNQKTIKRYSCDQCQSHFRYKIHYDKHMNGHKRNNCTYCDVRLTRRKQLVDHLMVAHSIKLERTVMFKCDYCEKRYVKKLSLYHHLKQHANDKIVCLQCGRMSVTLDEHNKHFSEHDKDRPFKCDKCNDRFSRRQQYLIHMKRHDRYKCITCDETFASKVRILRHKLSGHTVHGLEPQLKCPHCPMAFQRRLTLQLHLKKHSEVKHMYCKYCNKHFRSPYLYFKHCTTAVHDINSPVKQQLVCEQCGKLFVKKFQLNQHLLRVHDHSKAVFSCEFCGHKTINRKNLDRHLSLHLEDKKEIICEQCGKAFYNLTTLKDHISYVHLQEKQFKCTDCDKAFKRNSELIRHKSCHSQVRSHVCKTCGASYKRNAHLKRHEESQHGQVTKNRRVQRLRKDETGKLIPVVLAEPKKSHISAKKKCDETVQKKCISFLNAHSGNMVTFTLPDANSGTTVLNLNSETLSSELVHTNILLNPNQSILLTNEIATNEPLNLVRTLNLNKPTELCQSTSFVPETTQINTPTTCDILLPETRILNLSPNVSNDFAQYL